MRLFGILADYEDQNDHDTLRTDPVFKLIAGRSPDENDLASQPTLSRFENAIDCPSLKRLRDVFIDQFIASFATPPRRLTFDIDAVDDPAHGPQQLVLFHGYFEQYQYLPLVTTCAENDQVVMVSLRHGTAHAALGADDDVEYLTGRLRQVWPDVHIHVRGDAGCGVPWMYDVCERLDVAYTFGLAANAVLQRETADLLAEAVRGSERQEPANRNGLFRRLLVSSRHLGPPALGDRQGRSPCPRNQSPFPRQQSARRRLLRTSRPTTTTRCAARARTATRSSS